LTEYKRALTTIFERYNFDNAFGFSNPEFIGHQDNATASKARYFVTKKLAMHVSLSAESGQLIVWCIGVKSSIKIS